MDTCPCMYRCPWRLERDVESYGDEVIGVIEPANVGTRIGTLILMTEQLTLPGWVSPCQSLSFPTLLKFPINKVASWLNPQFSQIQNKWFVKSCFERQIRTCKEYTWSGVWHTVNTLIFLKCDRKSWDVTLGGGGGHEAQAQMNNSLSLGLSLQVSYGLRS